MSFYAGACSSILQLAREHVPVSRLHFDACTQHEYISRVLLCWLTYCLHQERDVRLRKLGGFPKCHFFNTFFINKLYK